MIKVLCLAGALCGAGALSQFPEFSQQYLQRLGGQVDELTRFVKDFDASALAEGLGREEALEQLGGEGFADRHQADMRSTFARHARLSEHLQVLQEASALERLTLVHRMADSETLAATWGDYSPAVPASLAGVASAGTGFLGGWALMAALLASCTAPFRRLKARRPEPVKRKEPGMRKDPPVARPTLVTDTPSHIPRLAGAQR
ncbi:DUF2937 family protein [Yoonia sp. BS5-3]|uniref:DUF2937 family protein n=1 Tax=Yoonia phaeophyticola TaxID=3137369 RepID=A0ABZ2VBZ9_9RHOB